MTPGIDSTASVLFLQPLLPALNVNHAVKKGRQEDAEQSQPCFLCTQEKRTASHSLHTLQHELHCLELVTWAPLAARESEKAGVSPGATNKSRIVFQEKGRRKEMG